MSLLISEIAVQRIGTYADELDDRAYRETKRGKRFRAQRRRLERVLAIGNFLFEGVLEIERNWRSQVLTGETPYFQKEEREIIEMYRLWLMPSRRCEQEIGSLRSAGLEAAGAKSFLNQVAITKDTLNGLSPFFEDTERAWKWFAITARSRQSPRSVRTDDDGRIFEESGERFVPPGMTQEDIITVLSERDVKPARLLRDIIAERETNGI